MSKGEQFARRVNNSIYEVLVKVGAVDGEFWCECDDVNCETRITLTLREFRAVQKRSGVLLSQAHRLAYAASTYD